MTTTAVHPTVKQSELITNLFMAGHGLDFVCERGVTGATPWSRAVVLELVRIQGWELDGSGRVPRSQRPAVLPPGRRPPHRLVDVDLPPALEAIAQYDETPRPSAVTPSAPAPPEPELPAPSARPRQPVIQRAAVSEAVGRFLAERTVPAPDDQYLTSPDLRDAYEAWRGPDGAPAVTPRQFGSALTARYRKRQSTVVIDGTKPMLYHGLAWKPASEPVSCGCATLRPGESCPAHPFDPSAYKPRPALDEQPLSLVEEFLLEEGRASAALDGETQVIGGAYTAASPRPAPELVVVLEPDTVAFEGELAAAKEALPEPAPPTGAAPDLLAVGREHPDRRVRAAARAVELAVDALCAALSRVS